MSEMRFIVSNSEAEARSGQANTQGPNLKSISSSRHVSPRWSEFAVMRKVGLLSMPSAVGHGLLARRHRETRVACRGRSWSCPGDHRWVLKEGYTVSHAEDGNSAHEALEVGGWDLVILDWWLPGPSGLDVLKSHRRDGGNTPVIFLTAARRGRRPNPRSRWRRRRLSLQAVRLRRAAGPRSRADPSRPAG